MPMLARRKGERFPETASVSRLWPTSVGSVVPGSASRAIELLDGIASRRVTASRVINLHSSCPRFSKLSTTQRRGSALRLRPSQLANQRSPTMTITTASRKRRLQEST